MQRFRASTLLWACAVVATMASAMWLGLSSSVQGLIGVSGGELSQPLAAIETIAWADLIPVEDLARTVRLADGSLPRGVIVHGQLPVPLGANGGVGAALSPERTRDVPLADRSLGGYLNVLSQPAGAGGAVSLKSLQPQGTSIRADLDGRRVTLVGYVTPVAFDGLEISEFLLAPYAGACIHVPPPPANQLVLVSGVEDFEAKEGLLTAVRVTGILHATPLDTDVAKVGYQIGDPIVEPYR